MKNIINLSSFDFECYPHPGQPLQRSREEGYHPCPPPAHGGQGAVMGAATWLEVGRGFSGALPSDGKGELLRALQCLLLSTKPAHSQAPPSLPPYPSGTISLPISTTRGAA